MVHYRNEWQGFGRENFWGIVRGMDPDFDEMPQLYENILKWRVFPSLSLHLRVIKGNFNFL